MKPLLLLLTISIFAFSSCKKSEQNKSRQELIKGYWMIHHVYLRAYSSAGLIGDSTVPNKPQPRNYIDFKGDGTLEYKFNSPTAITGTYQFKGEDSVCGTIGGKSYKWSIDLLIKTNFNTKSTLYNGVSGGRIETYQSFVRPK